MASDAISAEWVDMRYVDLALDHARILADAKANSNTYRAPRARRWRCSCTTTTAIGSSMASRFGGLVRLGAGQRQHPEDSAEVARWPSATVCRDELCHRRRTRSESRSAHRSSSAIVALPPSAHALPPIATTSSDSFAPST